MAAEVVTLARPPLLLASGESIGCLYTILEHFGSGPLGHTYRAHDHQGARVAVKVIHRELVPTAAERAHFVSEVSKLVGRSILRVATPLDAGVDGEVAFVVSPWVKGRSLRSVLGAYREAGHTTPPDEVLGVLEGVALPLQQLHSIAAHGAVYPESVQIGSDGRVFLADAGLVGAAPRARLIEHYGRHPEVLEYLSPELRAGKPASGGSDLYALGALASELLTGEPGAAAAGISAMLRAFPREVDESLRGLVAGRAAIRAAALPALLRALGRAIRDRSIPDDGAPGAAAAHRSGPPGRGRRRAAVARDRDAQATQALTARYTKTTSSSDSSTTSRELARTRLVSICRSSASWRK